MSRVIVVGDEDFTLGFELIGIESFEKDSLEDLIIKKDNDLGIIVISQKTYDELSIKLKNIVDKLLKPIVVILSDEDIKGNNLRDKVMKVLGVDLFS